MKAFLVTLVLAALVGSGYSQYNMYKRGTEQFKKGNYDAAIEELHGFLNDWKHDKSLEDESYYILGVSYFKKNDYLNSMKEFDNAARANPRSPNNGSISWHLAVCCERLNQLKEATKEYENTLIAYQNDPRNKSLILTERGAVYLKLGDEQHAKEDFEQALVADPSNSKAKDLLSKGGAAVVVVAKAEEVKVPLKGEAKLEPKAEIIKKLPTLAEMYGDEKRYALVIGNSSYPPSMGKLPNPKNDATDIAGVLREQGFEVNLLIDATYFDMRKGIYDLSNTLDKSDREKTVALFYYAGHGIQANNENYLVPVDPKLEINNEDDIRVLCIPVQTMVMSKLQYTNSRMNIIILDACRNNPVPHVNRSTTAKGLGEVARARGSWIAFATEPGSVAADGNGRNGLYTQELIKAMKKPGLSIEEVFKEVRANVATLSGDRQNTWDNSNITGYFYFNLKEKN